MKKIFIASILSLTILVGGCSTSSTQTTVQASQQEYFITIYSSSIYDIVYDNNTKVMYSMSRGKYNQGTVSVLYDKDGNILLYEN